MKIACRLFIFVFSLFFSWQVWGADDCVRYVGQQAPLPEADAQFLASALTTVNKKDRKAFLALTRRDLLFVRIYMVSASSRGGDLAERLKPSQIDRDLKFHIEGQIPLGEWQMPKSQVDGTGIFIGHSICDGFANCYRVPQMADLPDLIYNLLPCNGNKNAAFVFTDGILLTAIELNQYPNGTAYFFSRTPSGLYLSALVNFN